MEIKSCDKQFLIFLQTVGAKSVSGHHMWWMYVILEKMVHKSSYTKTKFSGHFSGQQGVSLYTGDYGSE